MKDDDTPIDLALEMLCFGPNGTGLGNGRWHPPIITAKRKILEYTEDKEYQVAKDVLMNVSNLITKDKMDAEKAIKKVEKSLNEWYRKVENE